MKTKIILAAGLLTSALWADFTLEYKMYNDKKSVVQYKDAQHVLLSAGNMGGDVKAVRLFSDDKQYLIMDRGGKPKYIDMSTMKSGMKGRKPKSEMSEKPGFKIIKTDKTKMVAGIEGQIWTLEYEGNGKKEHVDIVVTDDKKVVDAVHKYSMIMNQYSPPGLYYTMNPAKGYATIEFEGMELMKFDGSSIPDNVFALSK